MLEILLFGLVAVGFFIMTIADYYKDKETEKTMQNKSQSIQQQVINLLNTKMALNVGYSFNTIHRWGKAEGIKTGTLTSVISKAKGTGAIVYDRNENTRTRVTMINNDEVNEYSKTKYKQQNKVTEKICERVRSLLTADFSTDEVCKIMKVTTEEVDRIKESNFDFRTYQLITKTNKEPLVTVPFEGDTFMKSLNNLRNALDETITAFKQKTS
jgi:uncharacterized protein YoxC